MHGKSCHHLRPQIPHAISISTIASISEVDSKEWDSIASHSQPQVNPFVLHSFLEAMETSNSATPSMGWTPRHLLVRRDTDGQLLGICPLYIKTHSYGEFVFDQQWAAVCETHLNESYYPKLQVCIPFTPCPGPRLMISHQVESEDKIRLLQLMAKALIDISGESGLSSVHITFNNSKEERAALKSLGYLERTGLQFHWDNLDTNGSKYKSFDDFLMTLKQSRRKSIRQERKSIQKQGLRIRRLRGNEVTPELWQLFYEFYLNTIDKHYSSAYLTLDFFLSLGEKMGSNVLLVIAERSIEQTSTIDPTSASANSSSSSSVASPQVVAAALNLIGSDTIFGRNWGCVVGGEDQFKNLHFELCYYQAIEFAIEQGYSRVEAGAQGPHKLQRGYMPSLTHSCHFIHNPTLRGLVERSVEAEGRRILMEVQALSLEASPYQADLSMKRLMMRLEEHFKPVTIPSPTTAAGERYLVADIDDREI